MSTAVLPAPLDSFALQSSWLNSTADDLGMDEARRALGFDVTMAFQPIVHVPDRSVWAYEALVRGADGASAPQVLGRLNDGNRYVFDQLCRVKSIELAARLGIAARGARLSMNFIPALVYSPVACLRRTLEAARNFGFPLSSILFEITEGERVTDAAHMQAIADEYTRHGFLLALDDFGAGFSGLALLSELRGIGLIKLDGTLIRGIDRNLRAEHVVLSILTLCRSLGIQVLAECVETPEECRKLHSLGIHLMQGFLFARPMVEALPEVHWPELTAARRPRPNPERLRLADMYA